MSAACDLKTSPTSTKGDLLKYLSEEVFIFMKDICHVHQHHNPYQNEIVRLAENGGDEQGWRRDVVRQMRRTALSFRHKKSAEYHAHAEGILSYIKAFCEISKEKLPPRASLGNDGNIFSSDGIDQLSSSIKASRIQIDIVKTERQQARDTVRNYILFVVGISMPIALLASNMAEAGRSTVENTGGTPSDAMDASAALASFFYQYGPYLLTLYIFLFVMSETLVWISIARRRYRGRALLNFFGDIDDATRKTARIAIVLLIGYAFFALIDYVIKPLAGLSVWPPVISIAFGASVFGLSNFLIHKVFGVSMWRSLKGLLAK